MKKLFSALLISAFFLATPLSVSAETVVFNTKTYKYHKISCRWAQKCTVNCVKIEKKQAQKQGGVPCKVCGG